MQQASNEISNNRTCVICHLPSSVIITISIGNTITISIGNAIILRSMSIDNRVSANRCSTSRDGAAATSSRGPCRSLSHPGARPWQESGRWTNSRQLKDLSFLNRYYLTVLGIHYSQPTSPSQPASRSSQIMEVRQSQQHTRLAAWLLPIVLSVRGGGKLQFC